MATNQLLIAIREETAPLSIDFAIRWTSPNAPPCCGCSNSCLRSSSCLIQAIPEIEEVCYDDWAMEFGGLRAMYDILQA